MLTFTVDRGPSAVLRKAPSHHLAPHTSLCRGCVYAGMCSLRWWMVVSPGERELSATRGWCWWLWRSRAASAVLCVPSSSEHRGAALIQHGVIHNFRVIQFLTPQLENGVIFWLYFRTVKKNFSPS